jgi:hypothetical protein
MDAEGEALRHEAPAGSILSAAFCTRARGACTPLRARPCPNHGFAASSAVTVEKADGDCT